ncbi:glycosyl hydrolase family 28-related protein [Gluconobacter cerinus]|uniref:glycosyl hydrolase family 28-related protein n=1 Tax=Gluconobacter cerinus TaxID=38307 RepID=UPI001B8AA63A|nr:glycosyl hydrolase family 28-related protein [Gluconobacter cerinus]MBS1026126.1 hypothetical protein [Gluconobacter cerinus]
MNGTILTRKVTIEELQTALNALTQSAPAGPGWSGTFDIPDILGTTPFNVRLMGAKGDGVSDDTAVFRSALSAGLFYVPSGNYLITDYSIMMNAGWYGPGQFICKGVQLPAGPISTYCTLPVPSLFPTVAIALQYAKLKQFQGFSAFCSIQISPGTYGSPGTPLSQLDMSIPAGAIHLEVVGTTSNANDVVLYFDCTNNQSGFHLSQDALYKIANLTIVGANGWTSHGVWNSGCYGGAIWVEGSGSRICNVNNVKIQKFYYGIRANYGGYINVGADCVVDEAGDVGVHAAFGSCINCQGMTSTNAADTAASLGFGFMAEVNSALHAESVTSSGHARSGIVSQTRSGLWAQNSRVSNCGDNGIYANGGEIDAGGAQATDITGVGFFATYGGSMGCNSAVATRCGGGGFFARWSGSIDVTVAVAQSCTGSGIGCRDNGTITGNGAKANDTTGNGFYAGYGGSMYGLNYSSNSNTGYGFSAEYNGVMSIPSWGSDGKNTQGQTSPTIDGTSNVGSGNFGAVITIY